MENHIYYIRFGTGLSSLLLMLIACQPQTGQMVEQLTTQPSNEVILNPGSQAHTYIKESVVKLFQRPIMAPVTGKIVYDETRTSRVTSPISGRVAGNIAELGIYVHKNDALAELDSPELGQAQSTYANALSELNLATRIYQRKKKLYEYDSVPLKDVEQAEADLDRIRNETERARLKLANLGIHSMHLDDRFVLRAPLSGTITERNINPGMEIRSDLDTPLFVISDLKQLWVQMDIFEKDIGSIHVGAQVLLRVPAYPDENHTATVSYISQIVDESSRTVKVRCIVPNPENKLLPAMFASIEVQSNPKDLAVVVPLTALFTEGQSAWVYVNMGDYHYQKRWVKTGLRLKDRAVVLEGLNVGEQLVIDGALLLHAEQNAQLQSKRRL
ncbi:efflux RND transporter periplasmic adaptor subunit [Nitrosomonas supralitoralis]|uniref:Efflux RND transporter periplasmic adaptor subunit n=1 Tax=Nitrosomonas supralitoralis TaxID=2116706 RepID=A0A2P7NZ60_9PROT|nr:efflux RND transporter periplasmic adaptor subunit [Nitrosomonas supralitoralis]PSJ18749.1 efflux RND transporter periplasmic adaptor subunit [Nitrosomonas supralitoralis]